MKFYGVFLLLLIVKCSDQSQLECYSCDDCDIMDHMNIKIETCGVEFEQLVVAETLEESETVRPEMATTDFFMEEQTDDLAVVKEIFADENAMEMDIDMEMNMTTDLDDIAENEMTTESDFTSITDETTTDLPIQRVRRSSGPMSFCYKLLTRSGESNFQVHLNWHFRKLV